MMAGAHRSLQWRLTGGLVAAILLTGGIAALLSFFSALNDANEILDGALQDTAALIASGQMAVPQHPAQLPGSDPDNEILVVPLGRQPAAGTGIGALLAGLPDGMHTVNWQERSWRVLVTPVGANARVGIAQWTESRDEIAQNSALRTLVPLLVLIPLLGLLVREIVRRTLAPVASLARHVDSNAIGLAARLPDLEVPVEIEPFVRSLRRLLRELTDTLEQQRRFVANAAHELRSPMAALQLQAANLERVVTGDDATARLQQLLRGIQRMQHLLEQLLAMARSEAASGEREPIRLADMARDVLAQCMPAAGARGIDLGMGRCEPELRVSGTTLDLATLLRNAVENAVKYSPAGSQVTVSIYREAGDAVLAVDDEGAGIPTAHLERAFEPFYRVPGVQEPGSGLGLAIVAAVAKRLGGRAALLAQPGGDGLRFEYRQPLAGDADPWRETQSNLFPT